MKFKRHLKLEHGLAPMDIAPLIDVALLLLIFFMLSSSFTFPTGINVKLPKTITSEDIKEENYVITITGENIIYLNGAITTLKELSQVFSKLTDKNRPVLIKAARRASVGRIVDVWDLCRSLGIERMNIATDEEK